MARPPPPPTPGAWHRGLPVRRLFVQSRAAEEWLRKMDEMLAKLEAEGAVTRFQDSYTIHDLDRYAEVLQETFHV